MNLCGILPMQLCAHSASTPPRTSKPSPSLLGSSVAIKMCGMLPLRLWAHSASPPPRTSAPSPFVIFEDADWEVREAAVQALGTLGEHAAPHVGDLVARLEDGCWEVTYFAFRALGALGEHAVPHADEVVARRIDGYRLSEDPDALRRFCLAFRRP